MSLKKLFTDANGWIKTILLLVVGVFVAGGQFFARAYLNQLTASVVAVRETVSDSAKTLNESIGRVEKSVSVLDEKVEKNTGRIITLEVYQNTAARDRVEILDEIKQVKAKIP